MIGTRQMEEVVRRSGMPVASSSASGARSNFSPSSTGGRLPRWDGSLAKLNSPRFSGSERSGRGRPSGHRLWPGGPCPPAVCRTGAFPRRYRPGRGDEGTHRGRRAYGLARPEDAFIFAATNRDAAILNRLAQGERRLAGELGEVLAAIGGDVVHVRDRVMFTRNSRTLGVMNGDLGTVLGRSRRGGPRRPARLREGGACPPFGLRPSPPRVCLTTDKGQGVTCDRAFVLLGDNMQDLHLSYVQASRRGTRPTSSSMASRQEKGSRTSCVAWRRSTRKRSPTTWRMKGGGSRAAL